MPIPKAKKEGRRDLSPWMTVKLVISFQGCQDQCSWKNITSLVQWETRRFPAPSRQTQGVWDWGTFWSVMIDQHHSWEMSKKTGTTNRPGNPPNSHQSLEESRQRCCIPMSMSAGIPGKVALERGQQISPAIGPTGTGPHSRTSSQGQSKRKEDCGGR